MPLTFLLIATTVVLWPRHRSVHREPGSEAAAAVVATDPPAGEAPIPPTATLELATTTERGFDPQRARLSPPVAGTWRWCAVGRLCFDPAATYPMGATETVGVPLRLPGTRNGHSVRRAAFRTTFRKARESVGLAQVLLARLGNLPFRHAAAMRPTSAGRGQPGDVPGPSTAGLGDGKSLAASLSRRWPSVPSSLRALWSPGRVTVLTIGAVVPSSSSVVQFDRVDGLASGGYLPYSATRPTAGR